MHELEKSREELQARCNDQQHTAEKALREKAAAEQSLQQLNQSLQEMKAEQDAVVRRVRDAE
eukprot:27020-Eustigmatos_ZCMA.PRE.1